MIKCIKKRHIFETGIIYGIFFLVWNKTYNFTMILECFWHSCCEMHVMQYMTDSFVHLCNPAIIKGETYGAERISQN